MSEPKPPTDAADEPESTPTPAAKAKPGAAKAAAAKADAPAPREGDDEGDDEAEGDESEAEGDEAEEGEGAEAKEPAPPPPNRHERRRRKVKGEDDDVRDRNARLRQQLRQKRAEAERVNLTPLTTSEMIDDVMARSLASFGKWARRNANNLQTAIGILIVAGGAFGTYAWYTTSSSEKASSALFQGVLADRGRVLEKDAPAPKPDEEPPYPVYRDPNERFETALAAYRTTAQKFDGTGAATLARLGEAGILLEKRAYDDALKAYTDVRSSALGQADIDVKGRAIEGVGFALEGKSDHDGALKAFHDLEGVAGFKELALYHQARLNVIKGDKAKALDLVRSARELLAAAAPDVKAQRAYVSDALDELLRSLDPAGAPPKMPFGGFGGPGGPQISPQDLMRLQEQLRNAGDKGTPLGPAPMRNAFAFGAALGLAASLFGCESVRSSVVAEQPTWYRRPGWFLSVEMRRPLTDHNQTVGEDYERSQPELDPRHQRIFVGSADRGLYALRANDLSTIWRFNTAAVVQSEPFYDAEEDVVYFGSHDGALYKVRALDGELVWRFNTNSEVARKPLRSGGLLYVVNANDTLMAIEPASGKLRWSYHRAPALGIEMSGYAGPAVAHGMAYTAFSDGRVSAFDALSGSERWSIDLAAEAEQTSGELPRQLDVDATPIASRINAGPVVFVASYPGGVFALDAQSGGRLWSNALATGANEMTLWQEPAHAPRDGGPAIAPRRLLLVSSASTGLWALDVETGQEVWRRPLPEGGLSAVVPAAGALLVATSRYGLFLVSPLDGAVIDGIETSSGFASTPAAFGRRAFAMTNQGVLLSIVIDAPWRSAHQAREPYVRLDK